MTRFDSIGRDRRSRGSNPAPDSYYGHPIVKEPVWELGIPIYFFFGGLAGASAALALGARLTGNARLARNATFAGMVGVVASPPLLIRDLGKPARFAAMLRVIKVTSPMNVGTWLLNATGGGLSVAAGCELLGILPRLRDLATTGSGLFGLPFATYTAALVADTAIPAWHEARRELPFVFIGGAASAAGGAAAIITPPSDAGAARRFAIAGALVELGAGFVMEHRLGLLGEPYSQGRAGRLTRLSRVTAGAGAAVMALAGRRRIAATAAGSLLLAGALLERLAVFEAGRQSARDPRYVVDAQRRRVAAGTSRGASTFAGLPDEREALPAAS